MAVQDMHRKVDMKAWENRRNALWGTTQDQPGAIKELLRREIPFEVEMNERSMSAASESDPDLLNLKTLAHCLGNFVEKQFEFFYDGFGEHEKYKLNESLEFPPEYVFKVTLDQAAEDLEVIRRVADQRRFEEMAKRLKEADKLVWSALKPVIGPGKLVGNEAPPEAPEALKPYEKKLLPETNAMSYFQKAASIRVIPYAPVALIGIPFTATMVPRDYLSIPHEVGHYVYRHGKVRVDKNGHIVDRVDKGELKAIPQVLGRKLSEQPERDQELERKVLGTILSEQALEEQQQKQRLELTGSSPRYIRRWKEEIFADVYGCLVGGPVAALSIRDVMLQSSRSRVIETPGEYFYGQFTEDDGIHPVPLLRPYVYTVTLRAIDSRDEKLSDWADKLDKEWKQLAQIEETTEFRSRFVGAGIQYISVIEALKEVIRVVIEVLELLPESDFKDARWSGYNNEVTTVDGLYSEFEGAGFDKLKGTELNSAPLTCSDDLWEQWMLSEHFFPGFDKGLPNKSLAIDPGKAQRLEELEQEPRYTWNHVFMASGWATRPHGAQGSGVVIPKNWRGQNDGGGPGGGAY
jgi:hypothetical protein